MKTAGAILVTMCIVGAWLVHMGEQVAASLGNGMEWTRSCPRCRATLRKQNPTDKFFCVCGWSE